MTIFPTQYSTLSAAALKDALTQRYDIAFTQCKYLLRGVSDTYVLEDGPEKYILKIYRDMHRSHAEIQGEVELLNVLHAGSVRVAGPLPDRDGKYLQAFQAAEGTRYGVLFTFAKGASLQQMSDDNLRTVGREMARLHQVTTTITLQHPRPVFDFETTVRGPLRALAPAFTGLEAEYEYLNRTGDTIIQTLESFNLGSFSYGYCHYDFLPKNFHFDGHGNITFFDFDFAGKGYIANDLMTFWAHFALHVDFNRLTEDAAGRAFHVFLQAYREVRPFSEEEQRAIPYLSFTWWVFFMEFHFKHFEDFSNSFFSPRFIKERVALIKRLTERYCNV
jgi:Ser/Thr protein kinase RdoA (MazF antagonist)